MPSDDSAKSRLTSARWARLSPLIDAVFELPPEERSSYVERVCADDPSLKVDLERFLAECEKGDSLIDRAVTERFAILLDDAPQDLPAILGDRFTIEREVGRGGMATVFLAHDRKHDRPVAVKVLKRELAASLGSARFLREIRTAARLQHPHVMPLHDSGEANGFLYYVMPYVQGESLRDRLTREGQLPLDEALRIARDVASALDYAHSNAIVHRDIKPENILLSGGHAMVMDFGIARAVSASAGEETITFPGLAVGTPAYMSPEQATAGRVVDGRSDVYALACVVYEMLAGHPPFLGTSAQEILARQSLDPVPSLRGSRPDLPGIVDRAVAKALAKAPADRYPTASAFVEACVGSDVDSVQDPHRRHWRRAAIVVVGVAALMFAAFKLFRRPVETAHTPAADVPPSIAVLAFKNIGRDSSSEALSDGISEEIAATIGRIPGLDVKAPRSSFSLKDKNLSIREMGKALGVRYLVDGSVQSYAHQLRVRVALLSASNDSTLWRNEYNRPLGDVFAVQDDIARAIASELRVQLEPSAAQGLSRVSTRNAQAHELYLRGRFFFQRRDSLSLRKAQEYFERAIAQDSTYALAYTGLSDTYSHSSVFGYAAPRTKMPQAKVYVDRALALDSTLVEAHSSRAFIATFYEWNWPVAAGEFAKATQIDRSYPSAHLWHAWLLMARDSVDASIREAETALTLEPFVVLTNTRLTSLLFYARRYDDALRQAQKTFELDSTFFQLSNERVRLLVELGRCDEAVALLTHTPSQTAAMLQGVRGYAFARCGHRADAVAELNRLVTERRAGKYISHYGLAVIYAGLGDNQAALTELGQAYKEREWTLFLLELEPAFDGLRNDTRFAQLVKNMGLNERGASPLRSSSM
jgi:serine/threonine-protein kinase